MINREIYNETINLEFLFEYIAALTHEQLIYFIRPFVAKDTITAVDFFEKFHYDFDSLFAVTLYKTLKFISEELTENIAEAAIKKEIANQHTEKFNYSEQDISNNDNIFSIIMSEKDRTRKFYDRLKSSYYERNGEHLKYLKITNSFSSRLFIEDSNYYLLLQKFPQIKKFLLTEKITRWNTKSFFGDLDNFYKEIELYDGYDKFALYHHFESDCKIELFYRMLMKIKRDKRKYKWNDKKVQEQIGRLSALHTVPFCPPQAKAIVQSYYLEVENPVHAFGGHAVNEIVFDVDVLIELNEIDDYWEALSNLQILNYILNSVVATVSPLVSQLMLYNDDFKKLSAEERFLIIEKMLSNKTATDFYNDYLNKKVHIVTPKNVSKDITLTHFKKIYQIELEKQ